MEQKNSSAHRQYHVFVKFSACFLLVALAFRLIFSTSIQFSSPVGTDKTLVVDNALLPLVVESPASSDVTVNQRQPTPDAKCDIFKGNWIPDPSGPAYTNESCHLIEDPQNCMKNGRPDTGYLHWRWDPRDCDLPKFCPGGFLDLMRNKSWAFIGDSIVRNHVQSLVCTLSQVEQAVEVYHDKEYKSKSWQFPSHNLTVAGIWSPFLAKAAIFEDNNGFASAVPQVHLDKLDPIWTQQYNNFDYAVIAGGKWFLKTAIYYENNTVMGCHYCSNNNLKELGYDHAYRKVLNLMFNFITNSDNNVHTFFRTIAPDHYENGDWNAGGYCNRTGPFKKGEIEMKDVDIIMHSIEKKEFEKAVTIDRVTLRLLDTTYLSFLSSDGHPGLYRQFHPLLPKDKNASVRIDCLHWCLPGPIDSWNDLLMEMLVNG